MRKIIFLSAHALFSAQKNEVLAMKRNENAHAVIPKGGNKTLRRFKLIAAHEKKSIGTTSLTVAKSTPSVDESAHWKGRKKRKSETSISIRCIKVSGKKFEKIVKELVRFVFDIF